MKEITYIKSNDKQFSGFNFKGHSCNAHFYNYKIIKCNAYVYKFCKITYSHFSQLFYFNNV